MTHSIMMMIVDSRYSGNPQPPKINDARMPHIVNVWTHPTAIIQIEQMIGGFMVATDEDCWHWSNGRSIKVIQKIAHMPIFRGTSH